MERIPDASRLIVAPAEGVVAERDERGVLVVRRRRYGAVRAAIGRPFGVAADFTVRLDALGTQAWALFDGRRSLGEVGAELARLRPEEPDVAARLGKFVSTMLSHRMLVLR